MASGAEIHIEDLPPELEENSADKNMGNSGDWQQELKGWAQQALLQGRDEILNEAAPMFERTLLEVALAHPGGKKQEAAKLLGWGRNTLTRKLK